MSATLGPKLALARAVGAVSRCAAEAVRACRGSCLCGWIPLRSPSLRRACPVAACWCPPPTARPPRRRWPRASSRLPASRSCTTRPAPTWPAGSPRRCSMPPVAAARLPASSGCSRSTSYGSIGLLGSCIRAWSCWPTCFAISSTVMASWRRSPSAGPARYARAGQPSGLGSCATPTIRSSPI